MQEFDFSNRGLPRVNQMFLWNGSTGSRRQKFTMLKAIFGSKSVAVRSCAAALSITLKGSSHTKLSAKFKMKISRRLLSKKVQKR